MTFRPVLATWNAADLSFKIVPRFGRLARSQFTDGEDYPLDVVEHRSSKEHAFFFASVKNAWDNIQDAETLEVLSTPNKLRQWCLIVSGWCDTTIFGPLSRQSAMAAARTAAINFRKNDDYVEVTMKATIDEDTGRKAWLVVIKTPKSQSRAAMKKEDFRNSKRDVLEVLAGQIQVKRRELEQSGKDS